MNNLPDIIALAFQASLNSEKPRGNVFDSREIAPAAQLLVDIEVVHDLTDVNGVLSRLFMA